MNIKILSSAYTDLKNARIFYESQAENLGEYFFDSISSDIDSLILYSGIHQEHYGYHRLLSQRFPYAIYYKVEGNNIIVWRVLDCRQKPEKTKNQLDS